MLGGWGKGNRGPGGKAAYRRVYGFGHLRVDWRGPGSVPEPYARLEYETFTLLVTEVPANESKEKWQGVSW